jgi:hypothetical protein
MAINRSADDSHATIHFIKSLSSRSEQTSSDAAVRSVRYWMLGRWPHALTWWWEIWACIGSLVAVAATAGLLYAYDGKPQPSWPYGITLNSAVSWLSSMTKSFLLVPSASCISQSIWISYSLKAQKLDRLATYDAASRGPWGAFQLIWTLKAR